MSVHGRDLGGVSDGLEKRHGKFAGLLERGLLSPEQFDRAETLSKGNQEPLETTLLKRFDIPKKEIGRSFSHFFNAPFVPYQPRRPVPEDLMRGLAAPFLRGRVWVPLGMEAGKVEIATDNPGDLEKINEIRALFPGRELQIRVAFREDVLNFISLFTRKEPLMAEIDEIIERLESEAEDDEPDSEPDEEDGTVVQLVNKIVLDAHSRNASDIHIEPQPGKKNVRVRLRVDGICQVYPGIPYSYKRAVVSRIKIMSDLDIAERRKPQDGKIRFKKFGGKDIELRVATLPTQGGMEDVVLRILPAGEPMPLDRLGFSKRNRRSFVRAVERPHGLIFVCGPTGSGKTATLHSALGHINRTEKKIWTAEDPVEITQPGLRQMQVNPKIGLTFAAAMRSFLRADPDVIMVGEMRDRETTRIGIEASLTGHLVLSTLHTNNAPESISRLLDMGMDPFNFADTILCILAQRLILTLCPACKAPYRPSRAERDELAREYGREAFAPKSGASFEKDRPLFRPRGCGSCGGTGYRGRMAVHELMTGTDEIKRLIRKSATAEKIRTQAKKDGMTTLRQDGIEKILAGHCDLASVRKVCVE
ncbi:Pilus assembly protein (fragment) [Candidatus Desulfarcum epimagneticum]|uniref:Pilus assembly protein n=1 Tax=uncultured Desulfobacteraceae bacterium TaxID=218296 RepID=A0A484HFW7_9BACT